MSLMPTYGADLPPALVELAGSLLAQSRHKASTLRAEEEIARLYACAHLACDRLVKHGPLNELGSWIMELTLPFSCNVDSKSPSISRL